MCWEGGLVNGMEEGILSCFSKIRDTSMSVLTSSLKYNLKLIQNDMHVRREMIKVGTSKTMLKFLLLDKGVILMNSIYFKENHR